MWPIVFHEYPSSKETKKKKEIISYLLYHFDGAKSTIIARILSLSFTTRYLSVDSFFPHEGILCQVSGSAVPYLKHIHDIPQNVSKKRRVKGNVSSLSLSFHLWHAVNVCVCEKEAHFLLLYLVLYVGNTRR